MVLALDYEAFVGRALLASLHHRLLGARLPLGERAHMLREAARLVQRHMGAGQLLQGAHIDPHRSLLPLYPCYGLRMCPYFAA